jgi:hypothetical protein
MESRGIENLADRPHVCGEGTQGNRPYFHNPFAKDRGMRTFMGRLVPVCLLVLSLFSVAPMPLAAPVITATLS